MTTKDQVNKAFAALRKAGYVAKQNWADCQSCGWAAIEEQYPGSGKVVFYHFQDADAWDKKTKELVSPLYLAWAGDGNEIVKVLEKFVVVGWDGSEEHRIKIMN